ncbi:hypothetical protein E4T56_gene1341, partial [Termitomyces sp. T112]
RAAVLLHHRNDAGKMAVGAAQAVARAVKCHDAAHDQDHPAREQRRLAHRLAKAAPALFQMAQRKRGQAARGHHRQRQPHRKDRHQHSAQRHAMQLQAQHQHRDRAGARDQPARQAKDHDLPRRHRAPGKAAADILGM